MFQPMTAKRKLLKTTMALLLIASMLASACTRRQNAGESAEDFAKYRRAFYSAEVVYGIDTLGDVMEILKNAGVVSASGASAAVGFTDQTLYGVDEVTVLLENGLPGSKFDKARTGIDSFKKAVEAGAIRFTDDKAKTLYFNIVATVEVSVNLWEAFAQNKPKEVQEFAKERQRKARDLQQQMQEPWWNTIMIRGTRLATEISALSPLSAPEIWPQVRERSRQAHEKNARRKAEWTP